MRFQSLLLSLWVATCPATLLSDWIGQSLPVIGHQSILDLSLPGTHDTFTYDLSETISNGGIDGGDEWSKIMHDLTAAGIVPDLITSFARDQAQTQTLNVTQQLDGGIRFLDFRNMMELSKEWYNLHMFQTNSPSMDYLHQIRAWLDAHPQEILVLWLSKHGSECEVGNDQYPGVSIEEKLAYWESILQVFQGTLMDSSRSDPASTPISELVATGQRVLIYAADYKEFTNSSKYALDSCKIENELLSHSPLNYSLGWRSRTQVGGATKAAWKAQGKFWLVSGAKNQGDGLNAEVAMRFGIRTEKKSFEHREDCAKALEVPNTTAFCPIKLLGYNQLSNYYNQQLFHDTLDPQCEDCDLPNAVYLDAVDSDGTIRTGLRLLTAEPSSPVCDMFEWTHCGLKNPGCPSGYTASGEDSALGVVGTSGYENGPCAIPFEKHYQCCRDQPEAQNDAKYAYVATFIMSNLRRSCKSQPTNTTCASLMALAQAELDAHPLMLWEDASVGRHAFWPLNETNL